MANHNHHQQLNSHLTHQIHYVQLPSNLLPATAVSYQDVPVSQITLVAPIPTRSNQINVPRNSTGTGGGGGCVICSGTLPPRISRGGGKKPIEIFTKTCELLNVTVSEIQHEWEFAYGEKLPFCITCIEAVQPLIALQEQVEIIQKKLSTGIESIREKIRQASSRYSSDFRTANFRLRALGNEVAPQIPTSISQTALKSSPRRDTSDAVSDFSTIFANTGFHSSETGIQQGASRQQYPEASTSNANVLNTYANIQPIATTTSSQVVFHSVFDSHHEGAASNNAEEYSNHANNYFNEDDGDRDAYSPEGQVKTEDSNSNSDSDEKPRQRVKAVSSSRRGKSDVGRGTTSCATSSTRSFSNKGRQSAEYFSPVVNDEKGRLIFEGIAILPGKVGYACGLCGADCGKGLTTAAMRKVKIHIKGFHLKAYKCSICHKNFTSNDILSQHIVRAHEQQDVACDICARPVRPRYLIHHKFTHMNAEEKAASIAAGFKPQAKDYELMERKYMCNTCGKMFKKRSVLQRHEASHQDAALRKDYKCDICDKGYTTEQALRDHVSLNHDSTNVRKAMCKFCGKVMFPKYLRKHLKTHIAKEERPFVCSICGRRLVNLRTLQIHEAAHDPEDKPEMFKFECDICGQRFINQKRQRQHRRKIHPNHWKLAVPINMINEVSVDKPGEDDFIEDLNNEGLQEVSKGMYSYQLYEVKKLEDPSGYNCVTCGKEFIGDIEDMEDQIKDHIRAEHIGNFRCNVCTKRMKNISEVIAHKRQDHMNRTIVDCTICGRPDLTTGSVKVHVWSHKNAVDIADAINSGERVPPKYEKGLNEFQKIPAEYGVNFEFQCAVCQSSYAMLEGFYSHVVEQHPFAITARVKRLPSQESGKRGRKRQHSLEPSDCPECGKTYATGYRLHKHIQKVHRKRWSNSSKSKRRRVKKKCDVDSEVDQDRKSKKASPIKTEIPSGVSSGSDNDESEEEYDSDKSYNPKIKSVSGVEVLETSGITLRNRGSLRPRSEFTYNEDDDDVSNADDVHVKVNRPKTPSNVGKGNVKHEHFIEYITPDGELTGVELLTENDIKQSPHSSDVEEDEEWMNEGEDEED
ncbi:unnamed protein product [Orchesella dallaii]|uniref:C2H2-type domain-containing protein n=1 Tax=Orchesella dallaii TaxID=48710 RepID=A0ABP1QEL9_9HEXA